MFKINNKDNRTRPYFTPCSSVSIVNFEHVNADWVITVKRLRGQVEFLFADKHQNKHVSTIAFGRHGQPCPKYPH